jgi:hypothetical protein
MRGLFEKLMAKYVSDSEKFEYDWVIKKRDID